MAGSGIPAWQGVGPQVVLSDVYPVGREPAAVQDKGDVVVDKRVGGIAHRTGEGCSMGRRGDLESAWKRERMSRLTVHIAVRAFGVGLR